MNTLDMILMRTTFVLVASLLWTKAVGQTLHIPKEQRGRLALRSVTGTVGAISITYGVKMIPLVIVQTLSNLTPFWASLFAWWAIGEKMTPIEITALLISFVGVCLITMIGHEESEIHAEQVELDETFKMDPGMVKLIGCSLVIVMSLT